MGAQVFLPQNRQPYSNQLSANRNSRSILFQSKKCYLDALKHFVKFCGINNLSPMTCEIGMEMMEDFVYYLKATAKLMSSTVANHLVRMKTLLKMASCSGYDIDYSYSGVNIKVDEHDVVTLDRDEITQIYVFQDRRDCPGPVYYCLYDRVTIL
jgi:Phage integrase SAM-like domain